MRIYISGPITGIDDYEQHFKAAEQRLMEEFKNAEVVNPTMIKLPETCTHDEYMAIDLRLLELCDTIYMLNGWRKSTGACIEYGYALAQEITIIKEAEYECK